MYHHSETESGLLISTDYIYRMTYIQIYNKRENIWVNENGHYTANHLGKAETKNRNNLKKREKCHKLKKQIGKALTSAGRGSAVRAAA